jgi:hypothetical protein
MQAGKGKAVGTALAGGIIAYSHTEYAIQQGGIYPEIITLQYNA